MSNDRLRADHVPRHRIDHGGALHVLAPRAPTTSDHEPTELERFFAEIEARKGEGLASFTPDDVVKWIREDRESR